MVIYMDYRNTRNITQLHKTQSRSIIKENAVLRNTYFLLGLSLLCTAITSTLYIMYPTPINPFVSMLIMFGLLFTVQATANSAAGIIATFAFTGYMGYALGPILHLAIYGFANGPELVATTALCVGTIFVSLSAYVATTKQELSYLGGTLFSLLLSGIILSFAGMFFQIPLLILCIDALFILVFSGLIMYHTSEIIHGGETNYILATISLYLALYNLFISILRIMMMFAGNQNRD